MDAMRDNGIIDIIDSDGDVTGNRINLNTRTIFLFGFIDEFTSSELSCVLPILDAVRDKPITFKINSIGGNVSDTQTIITELCKCKNDIIMDIVGMAFSGAALLALAGNERKMSKYGLVMLHCPRWETEDVSLEQHKMDIKIVTEHFERLMKDLLLSTNITMKEFREQAKKDWYLTPKMCLKKGIVNNVY